MKKKTVITSMLGLAFVAGACVVAYNPDCPEYAPNTCPDGGGGQSPTCSTSDKKTLNEDVGESSGKDTESSSGKCVYSCTYVLNGVTVNCGSMTNAWSGTKPGPNDCPSGSGSGSGGGGTGE